MDERERVDALLHVVPSSSTSPLQGSSCLITESVEHSNTGIGSPKHTSRLSLQSFSVSVFIAGGIERTFRKAIHLVPKTQIHNIYNTPTLRYTPRASRTAHHTPNPQKSRPTPYAQNICKKKNLHHNPYFSNPPLPKTNNTAAPANNPSAPTSVRNNHTLSLAHLLCGSCGGGGGGNGRTRNRCCCCSCSRAFSDSGGETRWIRSGAPKRVCTRERRRDEKRGGAKRFGPAGIGARSTKSRYGFAGS